MKPSLRPSEIAKRNSISHQKNTQTIKTVAKKHSGDRARETHENTKNHKHATTIARKNYTVSNSYTRERTAKIYKKILTAEKNLANTERLIRLSEKTKTVAHKARLEDVLEDLSSESTKSQNMPDNPSNHPRGARNISDDGPTNLLMLEDPEKESAQDKEKNQNIRIDQALVIPSLNQNPPPETGLDIVGYLALESTDDATSGDELVSSMGRDNQSVPLTNSPNSGVSQLDPSGQNYYTMQRQGLRRQLGYYPDGNVAERKNAIVTYASQQLVPDSYKKEIKSLLKTVASCVIGVVIAGILAAMFFITQYL